MIQALLSLLIRDNSIWLTVKDGIAVHNPLNVIGYLLLADGTVFDKILLKPFEHNFLRNYTAAVYPPILGYIITKVAKIMPI